MTARIAWALVVATSLVLLGAGESYAGFEKVPEPGSMALLASGAAALAGVGWWLRRK